MIDLLRRCFRLLPATLQRGWFTLLPLNLLLGSLEFLSAYAILIAVRLMSAPQSIGDAPWIGNWFATPPETGTILALLGLFLATFFAFKNALAFGVNYLRHSLVANSTAIYSRLLLRRYLRSDYQFYLDRDTAELINNVGRTAERVSTEGLGMTAALLQQSLIIMGLWAVLIATSPALGLLLPVLSTLGIVVLNRLVRKYIQTRTQEVHVARKEIICGTQQMLGAFIEIKLGSQENFFLQDFKRIQDRFVSSYRQGMVWIEGTSMILEAILAAIAGLTLVALGLFWNIPGETIVPLLGAYAYIMFRVLPAAKAAMTHLSRLESARFHMQLVLRHVNLPAEYPQRSGQPVLLRMAEELSLENVSFTYPGQEAPAVENFSACVRRGESIGLVGPSGAGKSTLMLLVLGLLRPTQGRISVDGCDIGDNLPGWRQGIGYVSQRVYLLDGTIAQNIALGCSEIDFPWLMQCVRMACLDGVIESLPAGLNATIGENGVRLSGGQRQRIAIARALYRRPQFLLFDEATSALDNETERLITDSIRQLHGKITVIAIAHRLSTVRHCDRLFFLKNGSLLDAASYAELYQRNRDFKQMAVGSVSAAADSISPAI